MDHLYRVVPKGDISGILPNNKRIIDPIIIPLNKKEFIKCMKNAEVYAIVGGKDILIEELDYNKAECLFNNANIQDQEEKINKIENKFKTENEHLDKYQKGQVYQSSSKKRRRR